MAKIKKIGFYIPNEDTDDKPEVKTTETQLKEIIEMLYKPNGFAHEKDFKTSMEIAYELQEMIEVTPKQVASVMTEIGFEVTSVDNMVCFVVFTVNN